MLADEADCRSARRLGSRLVIRVLVGRFVCCLLLFVCQASFAGVSFRTSAKDFLSDSSDKLFVVADFQVKIGEHLSAPVGKGKQSAPRIVWKNAEVLEIFWPEHVEIPNADGTSSGYFGYPNDFSLMFALRVLDPSKPIDYDMAYVSCGDACVPYLSSGTLALNGLLMPDEIEKIAGPSEIPLENLLIAILLGILGGLILNCMPCVFPIISIKIFSIAKTASGSKKNIRKHCLSVSLGIIFTFLTMGIILLILRQSIDGIGWGFYMQSPPCVFGILLIFLLCSLNFFNLLHFKIPIPVKPSNLPIKRAYLGSFASGVFGAIASSSCVGPFVGVSIASALLYGSPWQSCLIFTSIGMGSAIPFILVSLLPNCLSLFPKPGRWLSVFKEFMGFAMLFSCVWPIWTLLTQIAAENVILILISLIATAMFFWMLSHSKNSKFFTATASVGLICSIGYGLLLASTENNKIDGIIWEDYSDEKFDNAIAEKKPIFLNFTASWCMNCQFNYRIFKDKEIIEAFRRNNILAMKCDWSLRDEKVTQLLKKYGAAAVPLYIYHPSGYTDFKILPNILTKNNVLEEITGVSHEK
ncbi:MAG: thioredoxin family protein [Holosporales bacterium]|nr:thioredoxin family protein [Holosporales bacterium]